MQFEDEPCAQSILSVLAGVHVCIRCKVILDRLSRELAPVERA